MGSQLVTLTKNGAQLTQKGRALTDELLRLDQRLFSIASDLRAEAEAEGAVRLGITDGLGICFLVPELCRFSKQYPKIQVHLKSPGNFKNLRENQTDVILGFSPDQSSDMTSRPLGWLHFLPVASEAYQAHGYADAQQHSQAPADRFRDLFGERRLGRLA